LPPAPFVLGAPLAPAVGVLTPGVLPALPAAPIAGKPAAPVGCPSSSPLEHAAARPNAMIAIVVRIDLRPALRDEPDDKRRASRQSVRRRDAIPTRDGAKYRSP
jgi:hypothetical protein